MRRIRRASLGAIALAATAALLATGCSDDETADDATTDDATTDEVTTTLAEAEPALDEPAEVDDGVVRVLMDDYEFLDLPDEVPAGTRFEVENLSSEELHEVVAVRLPEEETRSVEELMSLSLEELGPLMAAGPPDAVLIAGPESDEMVAPYGDTLDEPGRYLIGCFIPVGAPMDHEGPPTPDMAPFHYELGMWAELQVT